MNKMQEIKIEKLTFNIGVGDSGTKLDKATKLLTILTGQKPIPTKAKKRIPTWGLRPGLTIGSKVTLRKNQDAMLKKMLESRGNKLSENTIGAGTFSFGIPEYIQIPDAKYDVEIGIMGLSVAATLERPGFRIKKRLNKCKIAKKHLISKEDTINFLKTRFNVQFGEEQR